MGEHTEWQRNNAHGCIMAGLFVVPALPLVVTPSLVYPFVTGKAFAFRILVEPLFLLWIWQVATDREQLRGIRHTMRSGIPAVGTLFLALLIVSTTASQDPYRSFWSTLERMEGLVTYLHLAAYYAMVVTSIRGHTAWFAFADTSVAVSVAVGVVAIIRGGDRWDGTFGNSSFLASYMLAHSFLAGWLWSFRRHNSRVANAYLAVIVLQLLVLHETGTRGAVVALVVGMITAVIIIAAARGRATLLWTIVGVISTLLVTGAILWFARDTPFVQNDALLSRMHTAPRNSRLVLWKMGLQGVLDRPLLGWGLENYRIVFTKYYDPVLGGIEPDAWADRAHSTPIDYMVTMGLSGFLAYLLLAGSALRATWRRASHLGDRRRAYAASTMIAWFVAGLFIFNDLMSHLISVTLLAFLTIQGESLRLDERDVATPPNRVRSLLLAACLGMTFVVSAYHTIVRPYAVAQQIASAARDTDALRRLAKYRRAMQPRTPGAAEAREVYLEAAAATIGSGTAPDISQEYRQLAYEAVTVCDADADPRAAYVMGDFMLAIDDLRTARLCLDRARNLAPRMQVIMLTIARWHMRVGHESRALEVGEMAFELNTGAPRVRLEYAILAIGARDFTLAHDLLGVDAPIRSTRLLDDRLVLAYQTTGQPDALLALWREHAAVRPRFRKELTAYVRGVSERDQGPPVGRSPKAEQTP